MVVRTSLFIFNIKMEQKPYRIKEFTSVNVIVFKFTPPKKNVVVEVDLNAARFP